MNITDIIINQDNHHEYDIYASIFSTGWNKSMKACMSLNEYLDEWAPNEDNDNAGRYAQVLDEIGIGSNSDYGWWSYEAVDPDNIEYFLEILNDPDVKDSFDRAKANYERMKHLVTHNCKTICEFVELFDPKAASGL